MKIIILCYLLFCDTIKDYMQKIKMLPVDIVKMIYSWIRSAHPDWIKLNTVYKNLRSQQKANES